MSNLAPTLKLELQQQQPGPVRYFHSAAIEEPSLKRCADCVDIAFLYVSSSAPLRSRVPMCARHATLAWAEWMVEL